MTERSIKIKLKKKTIAYSYSKFLFLVKNISLRFYFEILLKKKSKKNVLLDLMLF